MSILRAMTCALNGTTAEDVAAVAYLIRSQAPDLVFLQGLSEGDIAELEKQVGLNAYGGSGPCGFLSRHPITALQENQLGEQADCLRADLELSGKRIHLFNLQLVCDPMQRSQQLARLFDTDLLGAALPCATLVGGDFSIPLWGGGQWLLRRRLKKSSHPSWGANYPAALPLWPRDRFYLRGPIRSLAGQVLSSRDYRRGFNHLPIVVSFELTDTREYLRIPEVAEQRMRPAAG